jgi:glutamate-1-semialdehyde 2,1-aminomutase
MNYFIHRNPSKKVLISGTFNAHPVPVAAALATLQKLKYHEKEIYSHLERLGRRMEEGLRRLFLGRNYPTTVVRQGSAFVVYFMDHAPRSWRDIAEHHDRERDMAYRRALIESGVFHFPCPTKHGCISYAHTESDIEETLEITGKVLQRMQDRY